MEGNELMLLSFRWLLCSYNGLKLKTCYTGKHKVSFLRLGHIANESHTCNCNAKQKYLGCKKGEANQNQQLSDYSYIATLACDYKL